MKKEQQRRITEDKKDGVHEQLLHTVTDVNLFCHNLCC